MSFFKDFKDDFSEAINDILPPDEPLGSLDADDDAVPDKKGLDSLFEQVEAENEKTEAASATVIPETGRDPALSALLGQLELEDIAPKPVVDDFADTKPEPAVSAAPAPVAEITPEYVETTEKTVENAIHISGTSTPSRSRQTISII